MAIPPKIKGQKRNFPFVLTYTFVNPSASAYHQSPDEIRREEQLIRAAQQDPRKFGPLYEKYYTPIWQFLYKRLNEEEEANDLCSKVFMAAMHYLPRYEPKGLPFSSWLYRIASNEVIQHYRKTKKQQVIRVDDKGWNRLQNGIFEENTAAVKEAMLQKMEAALQALKAEELQLIRLHYFEKHSYKEIGEILGLSETNSKVKAFRVIEKLRKSIQ